VERYVALLRGINVGGRIIKMADLRAAFAALGLSDAETVLQSGNVIFRSDEPAEALKSGLERGLEQAFHYPARVQVVSLERLGRILEANPFAGDATHHSYVLFFESGLEQELLAAAADFGSQEDELQLGDGVLYWRVPKGLTLKSPFAQLLTNARWRDFHTTRNANTVEKILAK
jgi:uncharacterized protein (DUF1697 family)